MNIAEGPTPFLKKFVQQASRRWYLPLILIGLCVFAAMYYLSITPPSFTSQALVILDTRQAVGGDDKFATSYASVIDNSRADSQIQVMKSERLLRTVFDALNLGEAVEFRAQEAGMFRSIFSRLSNFSEKKSESANDNDRLVEAAFGNFSARVGTRRVGQSYVIELSYNAPSAELAAKLANSISMAYIKQQISMRYAAATGTSEYLKWRIDSFKSQLSDADAAILS